MAKGWHGEKKRHREAARKRPRSHGRSYTPPTSKRKPRSKHWYVHYPGEVYANNLEFEFTEPKTMDEVRAYLREFHEVNRLWPGTEVWINGDKPWYTEEGGLISPK